MQLIFATHNAHKAQEIAAALPVGIEIITLADLNYLQEIPETGSTLQQNALIKAQTIFQAFGKPCFADDTGLEVDALNGQPGVYSARYAGPEASFADNCNLLLKNLNGIQNRNAAFKTVFCYINENGIPTYLEGEVKGTITNNYAGNAGFGYDPIFLPAGYNQTFAEMSLDEKNSISHRGKAVRLLAEYLTKAQLR